MNKKETYNLMTHREDGLGGPAVVAKLEEIPFSDEDGNVETALYVTLSNGVKEPHRLAVAPRSDRTKSGWEVAVFGLTIIVEFKQIYALDADDKILFRIPH